MEKIGKKTRALIGRLALGTPLLSSLAAPQGANLTLSSPMDYQVIQRSWKDTGTILITGILMETNGQDLREHAARWAEKVTPRLEQNLK